MIIAISIKIKTGNQPIIIHINDDILRKNEVIMIEGIQEKISNKDDFITVTTIINKPNAIVIKKSNGNILFIVFVSPSVLTININNVIKNK